MVLEASNIKGSTWRFSMAAIVPIAIMFVILFLVFHFAKRSAYKTK